MTRYHGVPEAAQRFTFLISSISCICMPKKMQIPGLCFDPPLLENMTEQREKLFPRPVFY